MRSNHEHGTGDFDLISRSIRLSVIFLGIFVIAFLVSELLITNKTVSGFIQVALLLAFGALSWNIYIKVKRDFARLFDNNEEQKKELVDFFLNFKQAMTSVREGDLTVDLSDFSDSPQYHEIVEIFRSTTRGYTNMLLKIQKTSADVTSQAQRILETSGDQASGSSQQAAAVAQITSAMEELARTAAQIAENTGQVVRFSEEAELRASEGIDYMRNSTSSMGRMNERMNDINENAHHLGEKFQEIDKILTLITSIASETHILALNAAIEAASAGEFGARFGVIASEVRRLSDMSQDAVDEIKKILGDFQKSIQSTILSTEQGTKEFHTAMEFAGMIQSKLTVITDQVGQTTRSAKEISLATQQQKSASDQIVETLKDISVVTRQIASALQEFNKAANNLNQVAMEMQLISQNFTIESDRNIKYLVKKTIQRPEIIDFKKMNAQAVLEEILQTYPFIQLIYVTDADGNLAHHALQPFLKSEKTAEILGPGANFAKRPWFYRAMDSGRAYITNMYKSVLTNEDCFTVSTPILGPANRVDGVLGIDINAHNWSRIE